MTVSIGKRLASMLHWSSIVSGVSSMIPMPVSLPAASRTSRMCSLLMRDLLLMRRWLCPMT
jgi:hypothetical protein